MAYDEYHDRDAEEVLTVHYHGEEITCDSDDLDDFTWINSLHGYYHNEECTQCDECGEWLVTYNSDAEAYFCDDKCEAEYLKKYFYYSEYDDDYFKDGEDITSVNAWDDLSQSYKTITISRSSLNYLKREGRAYGAGDYWFISNDELQQTA